MGFCDIAECMRDLVRGFFSFESISGKLLMNGERLLVRLFWKSSLTTSSSSPSSRKPGNKIHSNLIPLPYRNRKGLYLSCWLLVLCLHLLIG